MILTINNFKKTWAINEHSILDSLKPVYIRYVSGVNKDWSVRSSLTSLCQDGDMIRYASCGYNSDMSSISVEVPKKRLLSEY